MADADRTATPDDDLDDLRVEVHRHAGRWAQARRIAERLRETEPVAGTFQLAVTLSRSEGLAAAEPLWRELARLVQEDSAPGTGLGTEQGAVLGDLERAQGRCFVACALSDWAAADEGLTEVLAMNPDWDDLANLAAILTDVRDSSGSDRTRVARCLARVTEARDAVRARYEDPAAPAA